MLATQRENLPGTLATMAAFFAYCCPLGCEERKAVLLKWRELLQNEGIGFDRDFLKLPIGTKGTLFR